MASAADLAEVNHLPDITSEVVERHYLAEATRTSGTSANRSLRNLSSFLRWCLRRRWITENPIDRVERISVRPRAKPPLSVEQIRRIFALAPVAHLPFYGAACLLGLRDQELRRLQWRHLHLERAELMFDEGKAARVLPIVEPLLGMLRGLQTARSTDPHDTVFLTAPAQRTRRSLFRRAGAINHSQAGVHDFRRSLASLLPGLAHCSDAVVRSITRHRSTSVTVADYETIPLAVMKQALGAYSKALFGNPTVCLGWDPGGCESLRDLATRCEQDVAGTQALRLLTGGSDG